MPGMGCYFFLLFLFLEKAQCSSPVVGEELGKEEKVGGHIARGDKC